MNKTVFTVLLLLLITATTSFAQLKVTLNMSSRPDPYLSNWAHKKETVIVTIINSGDSPIQAKFDCKINRDGSLIVNTKPEMMKIIEIPTGVSLYYGEDLVPFEAAKIQGGADNTAIQTGMLPAGSYEFCCTLLDLQNKQLTAPVCKFFTLQSYQAPVLLQPEDNGSIKNKSRPMFRWTPLSPKPSFPITYRLQVFEILSGQTPMTALRVNRPVLDQSGITGTQFLWPADVELPNPNLEYIWTVRAEDEKGSPIGENNGYATPFTFADCCYRRDWADPCCPPDDVWDGGNLSKSGSGSSSGDIGNNSKSGSGSESGDGTVIEGGNKTANNMFDNTSNNLNQKINPNQKDETVIIVGPPPVKGSLNPKDTLKAGLNGEFTVIADTITGTNGFYTGKGTVYINWLKARVVVAFDSICVDSTKKLIYGKIVAKVDSTAPVYPQAWAIEAASNLPFTNNIASSVVNWVNSTFNQSIPFNGLNTYSTPVKLPLGVNFPDSNQLAITELVFQKDQAKFNMVAAKTTPLSWGTPQLVGFIAKSIKFHPNNIQTPPDRIELLEDITIANPNNKIVFTLKKPTINYSGCYVEWDESGFSEYGVEIEAAFTRDWLIPSPDDNNKSTATIAAVGTDWNDLILTGNLKKSEIIGTNGMTIMADSISYDMSDVLNPTSISFPVNYEGETSVLFRGFYMKALKIELPETWKTLAGSKPIVTVQNMIIDNTGITFKALASNVIQFPNANVADLVASIDTVKVNMVSSSLTDASIKGRIGLPVSKKDSVQNPLKYTALLHIAQNNNTVNNFQLTIIPTGPIYAHLLKGTLNLAQTSNITAYVDKEKKKFDMVLNGTFDWNNIQLGPVKNVNFGLKFQNLGFKYNSSDNGLTFNAGSWSFASAQKMLANFPVTIKNIAFKSLPAQSGEMLRGKLNFDVICNLSDVIGGSTKLGVEIAIKDTNGQKFYPKYIGTTLDSIAVFANLPAVKINGSIYFISNDPIYGDGFKGVLNAKFNSINMYINAGAFFGNTNYNSNTRYRYWKIEALAIMPPPGIVFMPGLAFRGLGVAAYQRMSANYGPVNVPAPSAASNMSTTSGAVFTPDANMGFGFKVKAIIATTPKEETFNADVGISGEFTNSGGMSFLRFDGSFWLGAGFMKRADAFMYGSVVANYDFPLKTFYLGAAVGINKDPITTPAPVTLEFLIDGKNNLWHFIAGTPISPNTVKVAGIPLTSYAMFGNDIVPPPNFMPQTISGYAAATNGGSLGSLNGALSVNDETRAGKGFAFGIGINNGGNGNVGLTDRLSIQWNYSIGGEINLSLMEYSPGCITGINGWYAKGNVALYGGFSVYGHIAKKGKIGGCTQSVCAAYCCKNFPNGKNITIGAFGFGVWASGGFPKPTYLQGGADIHYNVLDLVSGTYHANFQIGNACNDIPVGVPSNFIQQDAANEQKQQLIVNISPSGNNIDSTTSLKATYGFVPNEAFDIAERQQNGTVITRTFQAKYVTKFEKSVNDVYQNEVIHSKGVNALGQYEYIIGSNIIMNNINLSQNFNAQSKSSNNISPANASFNNTTASKAPTKVIAKKLPTPNSPVPMSNVSIKNNNNNDNSPDPEIGYGTLPPTPPDVINNLQKNTNYRFTVVATLYELKNNIWVIAKDKNGQNVTQKKVTTFRTGALEIVAVKKQINVTN
ncbi:MAG: hypothetical protein KGZ71_11955 [Desulfobulbaceae bacterium]|nr:hypothetical protein [Desulfobulbaceae bacterium]